MVHYIVLYPRIDKVIYAHTAQRGIMRIKFIVNINYRIKSERDFFMIGAVVAILSFLAVVTPNSSNNAAEAQTQTGTTPNFISIIGTTGGESTIIDEDKVNSEICTFQGVVVRGSGVTSLGKTSFCNDNNAVYGWDISPNPSGIDTTYKLVGNGFSTGNGMFDSVRVNDGCKKDNDLYALDVNQFLMYDGSGDDRYNLVGDLLNSGQSISYSDGPGNDKVTFIQR
jgi:hypothetical protein